MSNATDNSAGRPPQVAKAHLDFLDSIRGLAATYVVGFHIMTTVASFYGKMHLPWYVRLSGIFAHGHTAVDLFIVLSGFCLMIPVSKAGGAMRKGIADFFKRRARRILPPYYACLVFTALITYLQILTQRSLNLNVISISPHYLVETIVVHLLLIHNLLTAFNFRLNGALWTVATEWQIYFVFALILLPIFRKWGPWITIVVALLAGLATYPFPIREACFWYLALFAMGMAAADRCFSPNPAIKVSNSTLIVLSVLFGLMATCSRYFISVNPGIDPSTDVLTGASCSCLIAYLVSESLQERIGRSNPVLKFLSSPNLVFVGTFSYSIYLIHMPLIGLAATILKGTHASPSHSYVAMYLIVMPLIILIAYGFHILFERPFMTTQAKTAPGSAVRSGDDVATAVHVQSNSA